MQKIFYFILTKWYKLELKNIATTIFGQNVFWLWSTHNLVDQKRLHCQNWKWINFPNFDFLKWATPCLFFIFVFSIQLKVKQCNIKFLPMTGFELRTSGVGSDRSTNWATTTASSLYYISVSFSRCHVSFYLFLSVCLCLFSEAQTEIGKTRLIRMLLPRRTKLVRYQETIKRALPLQLIPGYPKSTLRIIV